MFLSFTSLPCPAGTAGTLQAYRAARARATRARACSCTSEHVGCHRRGAPGNVSAKDLEQQRLLRKEQASQSTCYVPLQSCALEDLQQREKELQKEKERSLHQAEAGILMELFQSNMCT